MPQISLAIFKEMQKSVIKLISALNSYLDIV